MKRLAITAIAALVFPTAALAGPPFLTDDPEPTETGHWEIYAPLIEAQRDGPDQIGGRGTTNLGVGVTYDLAGPLRLLASGGPAFHGGAETGFHAFLALGIDY